MLTLRSKTPVRFEFTDGLSETTVTIQPDDESGDIAAKLRRVLELEGGYTAVIQNSRFLPPAAPPVDPVFTPADRAAQDARLEAAKTNGWNEDASGDLGDLPEIG